MKKVISLVCCATVASFGATELIKNGDFSGGTANWSIQDQEAWYTGNAETNLTIQNGEAIVTPVVLGQNEWESSIYQSGISLTQGKTYECSFDVRLLNPTDGYRPITFYIKGDYNTVGNVSYFISYGFPISSSHPTFRFTMVNPSDKNAKLEINLGQTLKSIVFDNFSLKEIAAGFLPTIELYSVPYEITTKRPTFGWIGRDDNGIAQYKYSIDGGTENTTTATNFTLPYDLSFGDHTFSIWPISTTGETGFGAISAFKITGGSVPVAQTLSRSAAMTVTTNSTGLQINTVNNSPMELNITNVAGRVVYSSTVTPSNNLVSVSNATMGLASGIYMLSLKDMTPDSSPMNMKISL